MTTSLTGGLKVVSDWNHQQDETIASSTEQKNLSATTTFTYGSGNLQIQDIYRARLTLTASTTTEDIDLSALTNIFGDSLAFTAIKEVWIKNRSTTSGEDLKVGAAAANAWTAPFDGSATAQTPIKAGGNWVVSAPYDGLTVTNNSSDILRITHDGTGDIDYDVVIKGVL